MKKISFMLKSGNSFPYSIFELRSLHVVTLSALILRTPVVNKSILHTYY